MESRDPDRIPEVLQEIQRVWEKHPDLRLGQLILNYLEVPCYELYSMEDDRLLQKLGVKNPPPVRRPIVDLSRVESEAEIHRAFADAFNFPEFYGENWDAFWDVLTGMDCFPARIIINGKAHLQRDFPKALATLEASFADCHDEMGSKAPDVCWR